MRRKWRDPEYQAKRAALEQTPEMKAARSNAMQVTNNDPEKRRQHSEYMKNRFETDEDYRAKQKEWIQQAADDPAVKEARSEAMKRAWLENPELFANSLTALAEDAASTGGRLRRQDVFARRAAAAPTTPHEHAVCLALNELGVPYFVHKIIDGKEADIYVPSHKLDIEVDGSSHYGQGALRDQKRDDYLRNKGHNVLRVKNSSVKNDSFISKLQAILK
jgi:very-short-patch-repair endonuclease